MTLPPVRVTWVPPRGEVEPPDVRRSVPPRAGSLRSGSAAASSAVANLIATVRSSQTMRFASASAAAISAADISRARSMVDTAAPRWKLTVRTLNR